ncbi:hypothetical protein HPB50_019296 [Hyalomma asiaticum]|uniref:Uncharacterized protein n=1 Tax=Hyalomma asiaticum TaxID=266040 RepID=A0ACB7TKB4_HYAAI|nr:hypothetical protein HPB50_019296 [Hyalomma asiaticum]
MLLFTLLECAVVCREHYFQSYHVADTYNCSPLPYFSVLSRGVGSGNDVTRSLPPSDHPRCCPDLGAMEVPTTAMAALESTPACILLATLGG